MAKCTQVWVYRIHESHEPRTVHTCSRALSGPSSGILRKIWGRAGGWNVPNNGEGAANMATKGRNPCPHCLLWNKDLKSLCHPFDIGQGHGKRRKGQRTGLYLGRRNRKCPECIPLQVSYCWERSKITEKAPSPRPGTPACLQLRLNHLPSKQWSHKWQVSCGTGKHLEESSSKVHSRPHDESGAGIVIDNQTPNTLGVTITIIATLSSNPDSPAHEGLKEVGVPFPSIHTIHFISASLHIESSFQWEVLRHAKKKTIDFQEIRNWATHTQIWATCWNYQVGS